MNIENIQKLLSQFDPQTVNAYLSYLSGLHSAIKGGKSSNQWWMDKRNDSYFADMFATVNKDGMEFDGRHITLQNNGVSYDYVAYKNKMLQIYPESLFDVQLVREGDNFKFSKVSGQITYQHEIANPFGENNIIGVYCIIKNKRGEFLTTLNMAEIDKHRKVAKTDFIWNNWFNEMVVKTVIKKACKTHFADVYQTMETLDNEQNDLEQPLGISIEVKQAIEKSETLEALTAFYNDNKDTNAGVLEDFTKACTNRKAELIKASKDALEDDSSADS